MQQQQLPRNVQWQHARLLDSVWEWKYENRITSVIIIAKLSICKGDKKDVNKQAHATQCENKAYYGHHSDNIS